jgi:periplasmic protein CpxP/Spy
MLPLEALTRPIERRTPEFDERIVMNRIEAMNPVRAAVIAAALALGAAGVAAAQTDTSSATAGTTTPAPWHHHAKHGSDPLVGALFSLHGQLGLNTQQQAQWDAAVAQMKSAHAQGATLRESVKSTFDAEVAKDQPDLASVAATADSAHAQGEALRKSVRDAWLNVYASLDASQKAMVAGVLRDRAAQMEERETMHSHS